MIRKYLPYLMLSTAALTVIAAWARVTHQSWNGSILNIAFIFIAASVIFGIFEIFQSDKIETIEKVIWALAFMFTPVISFIIYLRVRREKVIGTKLEVRN